MAGCAEWEPLQCVIDSGAAESVAPRGVAPSYLVQPSAGSLRGQRFCAAGAGSEALVNEGEKILKVVTDEGKPCSMRFQITGVRQPLMSVGRICDADRGAQVVFNADGGWIEHTSGERTHFERRQGIYHLRAWVHTTAGFQGQGARRL